MMGHAVPIPIGELCRLVVSITGRSLPVMLDASAAWATPDTLVVSLPEREIRLTRFTHAQLVERWGERVGEASHGWLIDNGDQLALVRPGGGLVIWAYNPRALDALAVDLLEAFEREETKQAA